MFKNLKNQSIRSKLLHLLGGSAILFSVGCVQFNDESSSGPTSDSAPSPISSTKSRTKIFSSQPEGMVNLIAYNTLDLSKFVNDNPTGFYFSISGESTQMIFEYDELAENPIIKIMANSDSSTHKVRVYNKSGELLTEQEM